MYVIDTNCVTESLNEGSALYEYLRRIGWRKVEIIVPCWLEYQKHILESRFKGKKLSHLGSFRLVPITPRQQAISQKAITSLPQRAKVGSAVDFLLAGYCIDTGAQLITRNVSDFQHIKGLRLAKIPRK